MDLKREIDEVEFTVVRRNRDVRAEEDDILKRLLSAEERIRADGIPDRPRRTEFVIGRALARTALSRRLNRKPAEIEIRLGAEGRPFCTNGPRTDFNVAHSGHWLICGVARSGKVGVDVEVVRSEFPPGVARKFLHASEFRDLGRIEPSAHARSLYRLWAVKEACGKATGEGLRHCLKRQAVGFADEGARDGISWRALDLDPDVAAAVARQHDEPGPRPFSVRIRLVKIESLLSHAQGGWTSGRRREE